MIRHGLILYQHHSASPHPKVEVRPFLPLRLLSFPLRIMATRTNFLNARVHGSSHIDFKTTATGVAANVMRNEISRLVNTVEDPATKRVGGRPSFTSRPSNSPPQAFDTEMQSLFYLFTRYLSERAKSVDLYVVSFPSRQMVFYGSKNPPLLPSRSKNLGSSDTKVIRPNTPSPDYSTLRNSLLCEPKLIEEATISEDPVPTLLSAADNFTPWANGNGRDTTTKGWGNDSWNTAPTSVDNNATWSQYDSGGYNVTAY